ncbi:MAG: glycoside hydrolase family 31 protein [Acidobacteriaceae bacterium]|nr:glycoside hydrolase family 31 protein [Acidobacteriaceae bacterium]MBV9294717.1 glycoside hydrolase family 31 protein [Acidobacteriaceae bacterium]
MNKVTRRETLVRFGGAALSVSTLRSQTADGLTVAGKPAAMLLTAMSSRTLRISLLAIGESGQIEAIQPDNALAFKSAGSPILQARRVSELKPARWGDLSVETSGSPLTVSIVDRAGKDVQRLQFDSAATGISFRNSTGPLFGLGEGGEQFDRRGQQFTMRNGQFEPGRRVEGARVPIPWLISADGWAMFFHQPFGKINLAAETAKFEADDTSAALPLDIFFVASREPAEIMREYAELTGYPHMPPLWSLGYQQSHRTLESRAEVMDEASEFRSKNLPCDTMIYLGTGFCPSGWNTGHGSFTFNKNVFPDPAKMFDELHREHFHIILHLTRPPTQLYGTVAHKGAQAEDINDAAHYWAMHREVFRLGVDGWWPDEGDTLSPQSRLARNRMYWEGPLEDRPNERPWALHRNGYAGLQRYGWLWSGDINSDWKAFGAQIPVGLNTGLTGIPYWGTDTGGFVPTKEYTGELYVRWFQFSTFTPLFRSHGRTWKLHLPWGWNTGQAGPIEGEASPDPNELHNAQVEPICRKYLDLRYQLLPYLYSAVRESHDTGMPIMRALWLHYPTDKSAVEKVDEYLWGRDILVAPVIEKGATSRSVYLPQGEWYDFWTSTRVEGGREIMQPIDLQTLPLYVRAGAIIPAGPVKQYTSQKVAGPLKLSVYPGQDGTFVLYDDDGSTFQFERGEYAKIRCAWNEGAHRLTLTLESGSKMLPATPRDFEVRVVGGGIRRVRFEGKPLTVQL